MVFATNGSNFMTVYDLKKGPKNNNIKKKDNRDMKENGK